MFFHPLEREERFAVHRNRVEDPTEVTPRKQCSQLPQFRGHPPNASHIIIRKSPEKELTHKQGQDNTIAYNCLTRYGRKEM